MRYYFNHDNATSNLVDLSPEEVGMLMFALEDCSVLSRSSDNRKGAKDLFDRIKKEMSPK